MTFINAAARSPFPLSHSSPRLRVVDAPRTTPAPTEALGVARAMAESGVPYVISFVITSRGTLLDGTPLAEAITQIDASVAPRTVGFTISCVHPSVLREALRDDEQLRRLAGVR